MVGRVIRAWIISIHALREEGDQALGYNASDMMISIHALREEGDQWPYARFGMWFISIHALREEGDAALPADLRAVMKISIHALREEGDGVGVRMLLFIQISIHALREEGDGFRILSRCCSFQFLSTPSARRATRTGATGCST